MGYGGMVGIADIAERNSLGQTGMETVSEVEAGARTEAAEDQVGLFAKFLVETPSGSMDGKLKRNGGQVRRL